jgi:hypothetical protein
VALECAQSFPMKFQTRSLIVAAAVAALFLTPLARSADQISAQPLAEKTKTLPVTTAIEKGQPGPQYGAPYVLTVTNASKAELKLTAKIAQSVVGHNRPKSIDLPEKTLAAGASWRIDDLAAEDTVTLHAPGYDKLDVKVQAAK